MALEVKRIRGTRDILPGESYKWQFIERKAIEISENFGFYEIRTPNIEKTPLFIKAVGDTTDVVQKEMYDFKKGSEDITLRPEGTAGVVRAMIENNLLQEALPVKASYVIPCFRHENPQAGRLREFHQFGIESFGDTSPTADAEIIDVASKIFKAFGIPDISIEINSIGCPKCRPQYNEKIKEYFKAKAGELCPTCRDRLERNPLRILDCKEDKCSVLAENAPLIIDNLCTECEDHFAALKTSLDAVSLKYTVNPKIVRGLDYYTKTVFEFVSGAIGAQSTVCGGGRYDLLVESMGGPPTPALGFAMGLERLLMLIESKNIAIPARKTCDLYIGSMGSAENKVAFKLASELREEGFFILFDTVGRSVKAQMKYANKICAKNSCIIGADELANSSVSIKDMATGESVQLSLECGAIKDYLYSKMYENI